MIAECNGCDRTIGNEDDAPWVVAEEAEDLGWVEIWTGWYCPECKLGRE